MNTISDEQARYVCAQIDRLVTVEMRISDYSRGVIVNLYEAAKAAQGGQPISLTAARFIMERAETGRPFIVTTGAGVAGFLPEGETDGPPGAIALAMAIHSLTGAIPVFVTDSPYVKNIEATAIAGGFGLRNTEEIRRFPFTTMVLSLSAGEASRAEAVRYVEELDPCLVIAVEKIGTTPDGHAASASGTRVSPSTFGLAEAMFDRAREKGIGTIGVGDNGNELGFGKITDAIHRFKPRGAELATRVDADVLFPANTSNWGAYAIAAALALLSGRQDIAHTPEGERRILEACVAHGAADGSTGRHMLAVDGMAAEAHYALLTLLQHIVRNGSLTNYRRPF